MHFHAPSGRTAAGWPTSSLAVCLVAVTAVVLGRGGRRCLSTRTKARPCSCLRIGKPCSRVRPPLAWQPGSNDPRQLYRLLDAPAQPLPGRLRTLAGRLSAPARSIGTGRRAGSQNSAAGALPDDGLLVAARFGPAALFPLSLLLIFQAGTRLGGRALGCLAALLLASSALVLIAYPPRDGGRRQ